MTELERIIKNLEKEGLQEAHLEVGRQKIVYTDKKLNVSRKVISKKILFIIPSVLLSFLIVGAVAFKFLKNNGPIPPPPPPVENASVPNQRVNVLEQVRKNGVLRIGVEPDGPPLNYIDENGNYENKDRKGFDYEIAAEVANRIGIKKITMVLGEYKELPNLVKEDKADVIMGGYIPDPSIDGIVWSKSYLEL